MHLQHRLSVVMFLSKCWSTIFIGLVYYQEVRSTSELQAVRPERFHEEWRRRYCSIRAAQVVSGLPARTSVERLNVLDDNLHIISFSIIGGDHQLRNYHSTMLLQQKTDEPNKTAVMESYMVDVLAGNNMEETCYFVNNILRWNLETLARVAKRMSSSPSR